MSTIKEYFIKSRTKNMQAANESAARTRVEPNADQKRRMAKMKAKKKVKTKKLLIRTAIAAGVIILCFVGFFVMFGIFNDTAFNKEDKTRYEIVITENTTKDEVARTLKELGCIGDEGMFKTRCLVYDLELVPGTYHVSPSFTTEKIVNILSGYDYSDGTMDETEVATTTTEAESSEENLEESSEENVEE